jgi:glycosyltransferase involved in cell wall biosynthesis
MIVQEPTSPVRSQRALAAQAAQRLNVLMVTDHLGHANGVIHGASHYYLQVLPRLDSRRFNVTLCVLRDRHPFADELEAAGVHPIFLNRPKWDVRALTDLYRLVRSTRVDLLHCLAMKGCLCGRIVAHLTGTPAIIHLHDTNDPGRLIGMLQRRVAPWTARALAVSDTVRRYTHEQLGVPLERIETLHNGLDLRAFGEPAAGARQRIRREFALNDQHLAVMLAGRVVEIKGQRLMIDLLPTLLEKEPTLRLLIVGDGPDLPECRARAERLGVGHAVRFTGQRRDMPEIIAAADMAVMPSLQDEGFGFTALEAAAGGKPVVAFAGGAIGEIVEDGRSGRVVRRGDRDGLASAVLQLAADRALAARMGQAGAARAARFGIDAHIGRLEQVYSEVACLTLQPPGESA